jgi:hypothetical protein
MDLIRSTSISSSHRDIMIVATPFPITFTRARVSLKKRSMPRISPGRAMRPFPRRLRIACAGLFTANPMKFVEIAASFGRSASL